MMMMDAVWELNLSRQECSITHQREVVKVLAVVEEEKVKAGEEDEVAEGVEVGVEGHHHHHNHKQVN